jgi:small-conductance mechanosensitive channel
MDLLNDTYHAIQPLVPGLVVAGILIAVLVVLRLLLRTRDVARTLRFPLNLLWTFLGATLLTLLAGLYWPRGFAALEVVSLLILALALVLAISSALFDLFLGQYRRIQVPKILRDIVVIVVYVVTIFIVLGRSGVNLTSVLTTSAVLTAIIGFALQDLLSNIISGIALQIERPFKVGDWLMLEEFDEQQGRVLEMNWRSVKLQTLHRDVVIMPNNVLTRASVINLSEPDSIHRRKLTIGLRYEAPPNQVKASILRAVRSVEGVLGNPEPFVLLSSYDDFSIAYRVHFFIDQLARRERIADQVYTRIWYQLRRDGFSIPFPIRDINLRQVTADEQRARQEREQERVLAILDSTAFLAPLSKQERQRLAREVDRERYGAGEAVVRQGQPGDSFFIIAEGQVDVLVANHRVASLGPGDYFGEASLMTGEPRGATIVTRSDSDFIVVRKPVFQALIASNQDLIGALADKLEVRRSASNATVERLEEQQPGEPAEDRETLVGRIRRFLNLD